MAEMDTYVKMSQETQLWSAAGDGAEYVVRGAVVHCDKGKKSCVLNLPKDYGLFTSANRPKISSKDTKTSNIGGFGLCGKDKQCVPKLSDWQYVEGNDKIVIDEKTYYAVSQNAIAQCTNGGTVKISSSGQAEPDAKSIDLKKFTNIIKENSEIVLQEYVNENANVANPSNATSLNESTTNDIFGKIEAAKTGVYTITISISSGTSDSSVLKGMVLYVYTKSRTGLTYKQAYPLTFNAGTNPTVSLDWLIDVTVDYYFELDWAYLSGVELKCKMVPYSESMIRTLSDEEYGVYWGIDENIFNALVNDGWSCLHLQDTFGGAIKISEIYLDALGEEEVVKKSAYNLLYSERFKDETDKITEVLMNIAPTAIGLLAYLVAGTAAATLSGASMLGSILSIILTCSQEETLEEQLMNALLDWDHKNEKRHVACKITCYFKLYLDSVPSNGLPGSRSEFKFIPAYTFTTELWKDASNKSVDLTFPQYLKGYSGTIILKKK